MLALRPRWETANALVDFIDDELRPAGYRIVGVFDGRESEALAVAGFREVRSLAWPRRTGILAARGFTSTRVSPQTGRLRIGSTCGTGFASQRIL